MNGKKTVQAVAMALAALTLCACGGRRGGGGGTPSGTQTEAQATEEPRRDFGTMITASSEFEQLVLPFWRMDTMYNESTAMIEREDGTVTAKLLFKPKRILSVKDNALRKEFQEGVDYTWDGESNTLTWLEGSAIAYFTQNDLAGKREDGTLLKQFKDNADFDKLGRARIGNALFCMQAYLYEKQIAVTYEYEYNSWYGDVTEYQGDLLPRTMETLRNHQNRLRVIFYGDSIFTGCDSSKMYNRAPNQDSFPAMVRQYLQEHFGAGISLQNPSVGGTGTAWGAENADTLVADRHPDLVFIGFGVNDGNTAPATAAANIRSIIDTVSEKNPDCEFVVVAPVLPNRDSGFLTVQGEFRGLYKALSREGVAFVDMSTFHEKLLERKDFISMSGNNVNHPNDWLIRVYAMNLLSVFVEW